MRRAASLAVAGLIIAGGASAQPAENVQWELIAVAPTQVIFFDARPDRIDSGVERSIVFTFHVLKTPMPGPGGTPYTMFLQRTMFSCLEPKLSRIWVAGYNDAWDLILTNDTATPMIPFKLGTATADISVMACDHFNPTDFEEKFVNRDAAIAFAKAKLAGN